MNTPYKLAVFDWEGTLGDTLGHILESLKHVTQELNLPDCDESIARQTLIYGLRVAVKKLFTHLSMEQQEDIIVQVQNRMLTRSQQVYLFPDVRSMLTDLHAAGITLAIASNKGRSSLQKALQESTLAPFFSTTKTASELPAKPDALMLAEILDECDVKAKEALVVGDSLSDIEMAQNAQVDSVGVNFYNQTEQITLLLNAGAKQVFTDFAALKHFILTRGVLS